MLENNLAYIPLQSDLFSQASADSKVAETFYLGPSVLLDHLLLYFKLLSSSNEKKNLTGLFRVPKTLMKLMQSSVFSLHELSSK